MESAESGPASTAQGNGVSPPRDRIVKELRGDLPCVRCRYNLRGLTVKGMCPECGLSVRTTLLAVVDPMARELRPISFPRITATGLILWSVMGTCAAFVIWMLRLIDLVPGAAAPVWLRWLVLGCTAASGVCAAAIVRPHAGIPTRTRLMALLGVLAYVPLCVLMYWVHLKWDPVSDPPYSGVGGGAGGGGGGGAVSEGRVVLRLLSSGLIVLILLTLRPSARLLQSRWLLMRIGAVDRQTMLAMVAVVAVWSVGDAAILLAPIFHGGVDQLVRAGGQFVVLGGSLLFTIGLVGVVIDCWRVRDVILQPPLTQEEVLSPGS